MRARRDCIAASANTISTNVRILCLSCKVKIIHRKGETSVIPSVSSVTSVFCDIPNTPCTYTKYYETVICILDERIKDFFVYIYCNVIMNKG
jgi:hypothetical protein